MSHCSKLSIAIPSVLALVLAIVGLRYEVSVWIAKLKQVDMCEFFTNKSLWIIIGFIIIITLLVSIVCSIKSHTKALKELKAQISGLGHSAKFVFYNQNVENYIRFTAYVAIFFCLGVAIHYMANELPRVLKVDKQNNIDLGVDYLGLIVAIFAIIVTLLVTWQIYSTIKAKEELKEATEDIENRFNKRLSELDECCRDGKNQLINLNKTFEVNGKRLISIEDDLKHKIESLDKKVFKLSLRNNGAAALALNIDTCFELLGLMTLDSEKRQKRGIEPRFKKAERDIIYILEDFKDRREIITCIEPEFENYTIIAKRLNVKWMREYLVSFKVFNGNMTKELSYPEKEALFDKDKTAYNV